MNFVFEGYQTQKEPEGYVFEGTEEQPSRLRSLLSAFPKGIIKGAQDFNPLFPSGPIPKEAGLKMVEKILPTRRELPEELLERGGKLAPLAAVGPEGLIPKILQTVTGTAAGQLAKEEGLGELGQSLFELGGMGIPGLAKAGIEKVLSVSKSPIEKLPSGLTKPRAIEGKFPSKATISGARQEKSINQLNEEAAKLAQETTERELPISKKIQEGFDFEGEFEKGFGELQKTAEKANPTIDITDVSKYLNSSRKKYHGIPLPHPEAKKVIQEIRALSEKPQTGLRNLLKIYRSNNQKIRNIFETSRLTGKQREYVDFLSGLNKNIATSFEKTLPGDSEWMKRFSNLNAEYRQFKNAQKTLHQIKPILKQEATPASLQKFAEDKKLQDKLVLSMGKEGADQIIQIAKDLRLAKEAIKKIPVRDFNKWEHIYPLGIFVPGIQIPGGIVAAKKGIDYLRRIYGHLLTTPARRKAYHDAVKAVISNNLSAYSKAVETLKQEMDKKD